MRQITKNFNLQEFIQSDTADRLGIDNTPSEQAVKNITLLCTKLLQPLRDLCAKPLYINSGYRCEELNKAVGGVESSQHRQGLAADVRCEGLTPCELANRVIGSGLNYDQMGLYPSFIHLSYNRYAENRMQVFYSDKYEGAKL